MYGEWRFPVRGLGLLPRDAHQRLRSGERHATATVMGFNRMSCREHFSPGGRALRTKNQAIVTLCAFTVNGDRSRDQQAAGGRE